MRASLLDTWEDVLILSALSLLSFRMGFGCIHLISISERITPNDTIMII